MRSKLAMLSAGLVILTTVFAQEPQSRLYVALYGRGPKWVEGTRVDRQPGIAEHAGYMIKLFREGKLKQGGPFLDDSGGMTVFAAEDDEEAKAIVAADPAIQSGIMRLDSLRPWLSVDWVRMSRGPVQVAETTCKDYYDCAKVWRLMTKSYPANLKEMEAPLRPGEAIFVRIEKDPWGNPYVLVKEGKQIWVRSRGPDGKEGTADDISYPAEE